MWAFSVTLPSHLSLVEVAAPKAEALQSGEVLVRMLAGGICGSDLDGFTLRGIVPGKRGADLAPDLPGYPMHEIVGEVVASSAPDIREGERVVGWGRELSSLCEYTVASGSELCVIDEVWDPAVAVLVQPLACVLYAVDQLRDVRSLDVAVIGQGPIGLLFSHVLRSRDARHVTGVDLVSRREVAEVFGVDRPVHSSSERWALSLDDDARPQVIVEAVGHQGATLFDAIEAVAPGGEIYYFGVPPARNQVIDLWSLFRKAVTLRGGTTRQRRKYLLRAVAYVRDHPSLLEHYVTHIFDITETQRAYEVAATPARCRLKVTIRMASP